MQTKTDPFAYALHKVELFTKVDEQEVPVTAVIRKPFECIDATWLCAASISGLIHRKADMERATADECVKAVRKFVVEELSGYLAEGGSLYMANGKPVTDLRSVFPSKP
ncbi:MAG: hypothetical protein AB8G18_10960 [Gammaproteobacteria bacterium]